MKKTVLRVKQQFADHNLGFTRSDRSDVVSEELVLAEKRVDLIKQTCQNVSKKLTGCLEGLGTDQLSQEKRWKKLPDVLLSYCMQECSTNFLNSGFSENSILKMTLDKSSDLEKTLGTELLRYELEIEKGIICKMNNLLENEVPTVSKHKKGLVKAAQDLETAKTKLQAAIKHVGQSAAATNTISKAEQVKEEVEDAETRLYQLKDSYASELFQLIAREAEFSEYFLQLAKAQAEYHLRAYECLTGAIPEIDKQIKDYYYNKVYGHPLDEHLRISEREIALPIQHCILLLLASGIGEEGLFRVGGSANRVRKLKTAFDAGLIDIVGDFANDPHAVAGALKSYLRELPDPLMTYELYDDWILAARHPDPINRLNALISVVQRLPTSNYNNLRYLIKFLHKLAANQDTNKMSPHNIAIVIAPNLMWTHEDDDTGFGANMTMANVHSIILDCIISNCEEIFPGEIDFGHLTINPNSMMTSSVISNDGLNHVMSSTGVFQSNGDENETNYHEPPHTGSSMIESPKQGSPKVSKRPKKPAPPAPPNRPPAPQERSLEKSFEEFNHPPSPRLSDPLGLRTTSSSPHQKRPERPTLPDRPFVSGHERKPSDYTVRDRPIPAERPELHHERKASDQGVSTMKDRPVPAERMSLNERYGSLERIGDRPAIPERPSLDKRLSSSDRKLVTADAAEKMSLSGHVQDMFPQLERTQVQVHSIEKSQATLVSMSQSSDSRPSSLDDNSEDSSGETGAGDTVKVTTATEKPPRPPCLPEYKLLNSHHHERPEKPPPPPPCLLERLGTDVFTAKVVSPPPVKPPRASSLVGMVVPLSPTLAPENEELEGEDVLRIYRVNRGQRKSLPHNSPPIPQARTSFPSSCKPGDEEESKSDENLHLYPTLSDLSNEFSFDFEDDKGTNIPPKQTSSIPASPGVPRRPPRPQPPPPPVPVARGGNKAEDTRL